MKTQYYTASSLDGFSRALTSGSPAATCGRCIRRCARRPRARTSGSWAAATAGQFYDQGLLDEL
jgi:hypothetical protein